jgi:hypothetical protein
MGEEMKSPLENIFGATFLGCEEVVDWAKEKWIGFKNADVKGVKTALDSLIATLLLAEMKRFPQQ